MKHLRSLAGACALSVCLAGMAHAMPIHFDFSATVTQGTTETPVGTAVSGSFVFETDRMTSFTSAGPPASLNFVDFAPPATVGTLNIDGRTFDFPSLGGLNYAAIGFTDVCSGPGVCVDDWYAENFLLFAHTSDVVPTDGTYRTWSLSFNSNSVQHFPEYPFSQPADYFDLAELDIYSVLTLPLLELRGSYVEFIYDCAAGECLLTGGEQVFWTVDSVERYAGELSVPEPATFGLLGAGLLAIFNRRRRLGEGA